MRLSKLFKNAPTVNITGLCFDSRKVKKGNVYFCLPGLTFDGHDFIDQAIDKGAICIVHSKILEKTDANVIYIQVENVVEALNVCARIFYGRPTDKMVMYGVTGTNGKSTITNIIQAILNPVRPCGYIGTIAIRYGNVNLAPDLTTPDVLFLHSKLADMVRCGMKACALEVSSHGLAQHRVDAISFDVAIFTNFTYDHLDFHGTFENYFEAKSLLFKERVKEDGVSILNIDDEKYEDLKSVSKARTVSYGIKNKADYFAKDLKLTSHESRFTLVYNQNEYKVVTNLVALYNVYNLLAAIAALHETGMPLDQIIAACDSIPQIEGRMEQIDCGQDFHVIVDFAHTPDGMEKMMKFGRDIAKENNLISVFGSAGKRDVAKRKVFGEIAEKYCDYIILTEDDPRDESSEDIARQIKEGIQTKTNIFIPDRYEAIRQAVQYAKSGGVTLLLGVGDEVFMYHENGRVPWIGDNKAAKECIEERML